MQRFTGTSKNGDFAEALAEAIGAAKTALSTELVCRTLISVYGTNGGFAPQNDLTVEIVAFLP